MKNQTEHKINNIRIEWTGNMYVTRSKLRGKNNVIIVMLFAFYDFVWNPGEFSLKYRSRYRPSDIAYNIRN